VYRERLFLAVCASVAVSMETDPVCGATMEWAEPEGVEVVAGEENSMGDNSLTSFEDDVPATVTVASRNDGDEVGCAAATTTTAVRRALKLTAQQHQHHQPLPTSSDTLPPVAAPAAAARRHSLAASGIPSSLQLCKVSITRPLTVDPFSLRHRLLGQQNAIFIYLL